MAHPLRPKIVGKKDASLKEITILADPEIFRNVLEDCAEVYRTRAGAYAYGAHAGICDILLALDKSEKKAKKVKKCETPD